MTLLKSLYILPTWTRAVALVAEHDSLRSAIGGAPAVDACYRCAWKLREHKVLLDTCIAQVVMWLREQLADYGEHVAIDGSDPACVRERAAIREQGRARADHVL